MRLLERFLKENTPFAIIQYFEALKSTRNEKFKKYELIFINEKNELEYIVLSTKQVLYFKKCLDRIELIIKNNYGCVYEFNNFKAHKEKQILEP